MSGYRGYLTIIGLFLLAVSIIVLGSSPKLISSKGVSFVDTELSQASGHETLVWCKVNFKSNERMAEFPLKIGNWQGHEIDERQEANLRELLGANVFLMRNYTKPGLYAPIFFLILQAKESSAFHPPPVCYRAMGYHVDEHKEVVHITGTYLSEDNSFIGGSIPMKKLIISKTKGGKLIERRVVLYCYLKGNQFTSDYINLMRVSAIIPLKGSYEGVLEEMKGFIAEAIPYLFEFPEEEERQILLVKLANSGIRGWFLILLMFALPLILIIYPFFKRRLPL